MNLLEIASLLNVTCQNDLKLSGVAIDSRQVNPGNLFIAIQGERFDGHDFIEQAVNRGAKAVVCQKPQAVAVPQLVVVDSLQALAEIARFHRQSLTPKVIALTGSNGKTTVKEMISAILPQPAYATAGNLNNHIGAPLSALALKPEHRYAVFELGASGLGEVAHTVRVVLPHVALINNIAPAHIEGFGSIDGVARAKGEIYQGLAASGTAVVNDDDAYAHFWDNALTDKNILRFSVNHACDIYAKEVGYSSDGCAHCTLVTPAGSVFLQLKVPGRHNLSNALAAAACTYALGIPLANIVDGLQQFTGVSGRMSFRAGKNDSLIIDDTYNANVSSALTAIDVLAKRQGQRIFVFGDMAELGSYSQEHHQEVGRAALSRGIDQVMTVGLHSRATSRAFGQGAIHYDNQAALLKDLIGKLDETTTVLVKGSRSSQMENIVHQLVVS